MAKAAKKIDPFKMKKTKSAPTKAGEPLTPPEEIMEAIDSFRECQDQAKHFEGEATVYKDTVVNYCVEEFCRRALTGKIAPFKVLGGETMVNFIIQDSSAGITEEELEAIRERWGDEAADELVVRDFSSIKFDAKVLEANYDQVVEALQVLPEKVLASLFKPMLMKASSKAVEKAIKFAKKPKDLRELIKDIKIKNYIK